jgi:hypothetical protein
MWFPALPQTSNKRGADMTACSHSEHHSAWQIVRWPGSMGQLVPKNAEVVDPAAFPHKMPLSAKIN